METIKTSTLLRTDRILRRLGETCCLSNSREIISAKTDVKSSQGLYDNNNSA